MPKFEIKNTTTNQVTTVDVPVLRPAGVLPVPYISQLGPGAERYSGDCGAACGSMLLHGYNLNTSINPDQFFSQTGKDGGFLGISDLQNVMYRHGLPNDYKTGMQAGDLFNALAQQKPVIMLVHYGILVKAGVTERKDFTGPHFFLAVGMDNMYVYIHDPYCAGNGGEARPYPFALIMESWARAGEQYNNPVGAGVMPRVGLHQAATLVNPAKAATAPAGATATAAAATPPGTPGTSAVPYQVRIVMTPQLNIRNAPGTDGTAIIGTVQSGATRTVAEERVLPGGQVWGRIDMGQWILLRSDTAVKA